MLIECAADANVRLVGRQPAEPVKGHRKLVREGKARS